MCDKRLDMRDTLDMCDALDNVKLCARSIAYNVARWLQIRLTVFNLYELMLLHWVIFIHNFSKGYTLVLQSYALKFRSDLSPYAIS